MEILVTVLCKVTNILQSLSKGNTEPAEGLRSGNVVGPASSVFVSVDQGPCFLWQGSGHVLEAENWLSLQPEKV